MSRHKNRHKRSNQINPEPVEIRNPFYHLQDIGNKLFFLAEALPAWAEELAEADAVDRLNLKDNTFLAIEGLREILGDLAEELEQASEVVEDVAKGERAD